MPFIKSFIDKKPEVSSSGSGWDFSIDNREVSTFTFGGLLNSQDNRVADPNTSSDVANTPDATTLT